MFFWGFLTFNTAMHLTSNVTLNSIVCILFLLFLNSIFYVKCLQFTSSFTDVRMCSKENIWKFIVLPAQNCCKNSSCVFWILRLIVLLFSYKLFTITVSDIQRRIYFTASPIQDIDKVCAIKIFFLPMLYLLKE